MYNFPMPVKLTSGKPYIKYLTHSDEDISFGMVCTCAGCCKIPPHAGYPQNPSMHPTAYRSVANGRTLNEFQIIYITEGEGTFNTGGGGQKAYNVQRGSLLLVMPGVEHHYRPREASGWTEYWVGFKGAVFESIINRNMIETQAVFSENDVNAQFLRIFHSIFEETEEQKQLYQLKICSYIMRLLAEVLAQSRRKQQPDYYQKTVNEVKYILAQNIERDVDISRIVRNLGVSSSRLSEIFKSYTGMTPHQYFIDIKIHKAKTLLSEKMKVKEVAYRLGFTDQYYFSRIFKKKTGIMPSKWQ